MKSGGKGKGSRNPQEKDVKKGKAVVQLVNRSTQENVFVAGVRSVTGAAAVAVAGHPSTLRGRAARPVVTPCCRLATGLCPEDGGLPALPAGLGLVFSSRHDTRLGHWVGFAVGRSSNFINL